MEQRALADYSRVAAELQLLEVERLCQLIWGVRNGWFEDELDGIVADCDWCQGCGYVYRDAKGVDRAITPAEYSRVAAELERLEAERLRQLGYTGKAKRPGEE